MAWVDLSATAPTTPVATPDQDGLYPALKRGFAKSTGQMASEIVGLPEMTAEGQSDTFGERIAEQVGTVLGDLPSFILAAKPGADIGAAIGAMTGPLAPIAVPLLGAIGGGATAFGGTSLLREFLNKREESPESSVMDRVEATAEKWPEHLKEAAIGGATGLAGKVTRMALPAGVPNVVREGAAMGAETVALSTSGSLIHEQRLPTAQEFVEAATLVTLLTGAHVGVRQMKDVFRRSPGDINALLEDLKTIQTLRTQGQTVEADALVAQIKERVAGMQSALDKLPPEEAARKREAMQAGMNAAMKKVEERNAKALEQAKKLTEQGFGVTTPEEAAKAAGKKKAEEKAEEVETTEPPKPDEPIKVEEKPEYHPSPDAALALPEGHVIRRAFETAEAQYEKLAETKGFDDPEVRQIRSEAARLEDLADMILRIQAGNEVIKAKLEKADPKQEGYKELTDLVDRDARLLQGLELMGTWFTKGVPWKLPLAGFEAGLGLGARRIKAKMSEGIAKATEKLGALLRVEYGTDDPRVLWQRITEETFSPAVKKAKLLLSASGEEQFEFLKAAGVPAQTINATLGNAFVKSWGGYTLVAPDGTHLVVIGTEGVGKDWLLGAVKHEVKHIMDKEAGLADIENADRSSLPPERQAEYDAAVQAYKQGQATVADVYRVLAAKHHHGTTFYEVDAIRQWVVEQAVKLGLEVPPEILKETGVSPIQIADIREMNLARMRGEKMQGMLEADIARRVAEGYVVVRDKNGNPLFATKNKPRGKGKKAAPAEPAPTPETPTDAPPQAIQRPVLEGEAETANAVAHLEAQTKSDKRWYDRFTIEARGRRIEAGGLKGAAEVFTRIKHAASVWTGYQTKGVAFMRRISKMVKGNQIDLTRAYLAAETPALLDRMAPEDRARLEPVAKEFTALFKEAQGDYASYGVDLDYVKRRITDATRDYMLALDAAGRTTDVEKRARLVQQAERRLTQVEAMMQSNYVHLPYRLLWQAFKNATPSQRRVIQVLHSKKRHTLTLSDLLSAKDPKGNPVFRAEDFSVPDAIASYAIRWGRDISLLRIAQAAKEAKMMLPEKSRGIPKEYHRAPDYMPLFHGYRLHPAVLEWANTLSRPTEPSRFRAVMALSKGLTFFEPWILAGYNFFQLAMNGALINYKLPKYMVQAAKAMWNKDSEYWEATMNGIQSQPTQEPWASFKTMMERAASGGIPGEIGASVKAALDPNVLKMAGKTLMEVYRASWSLAWTLDEYTRFVSYYHGRSLGMSSRQAAYMSARFMGDYASVPRETARLLNIPFYTPIYKITMAKLFTDMVRGAAKTVVGKGTFEDKMMAAALVRTAVILVAFDWAMQKAGWEADRWGMAYKKKFIDNDGVERETVLSLSTPVNLPLKYLYRAWNSIKPDKTNTPLTLFNSMTWELHPVWRATYNVVRNQTELNKQVWNPFDPPVRKGVDAMMYAASTIISALSPLTPEMDDAKANARVREELGQAAVLTGLVPLWKGKDLSLLTYNYIRESPQSRRAFAIRRLTKEYEDQVLKYSKEQFDTGKPIDPERLRRWVEDYQKRAQELAESK